MTEDAEPDDDQMERASRIRSRVNSSQDSQASQASQASEEPQAPQASQASGESEDSEDSQASQAPQGEQEPQDSQAPQAPQAPEFAEKPVMERRHATLYLGDPLVSEMNLVEDEVNIKYTREYGEELGKNRHVRPLIVKKGLESVTEMTPEEIRDALLDSGDIEDPPESRE